MKSVTDVLTELLAFIAARGLCPGDRLPAERDLIAELGTSRPTLRKILDSYEKQGALERRGRAGTFLIEVLDPHLFLSRPETPRAAVVSFMWVDVDPETPPGQRKYRLVQEWLLQRGFVLNAYLATRDRQDPERERQYLRSLFKVRPTGLVALATPLGGTNAALFADLYARGIRVVHTDLFRNSLPDEPFFMSDHFQSGSTAVGWLAARGYRRIQIGNPSGSTPAAQMTLAGVLHAIRQLGLEQLPETVKPTAEAAGGKALQAACARVRGDVGMVVYNPNGARVVADELVRQGQVPTPTGPLIAIGDYDSEFGPAPKMPLVAFSWTERVTAALAFCTGERTAPARVLFKPRIVLP